MSALKEVPVQAFEIAFSKKGNALISFMGRHHVPKTAVARFEGTDLVVDRDGGIALRFLGIREEDRERLCRAASVLLNRTFEFGDDFVSALKLI